MEHRNQKQNILCMRTQFMTDTRDQNLLRKELISLWIHWKFSLHENNNVNTSQHTKINL